MKSHKCTKCGHVHKFYWRFRQVCRMCNCKVFEIVEIIDWEKELTKTEENGKD